MRSHTLRNPKRAPRRRDGLLRMLANSQAGMSIVEVLVSMLLVSLIAGATATALSATATFSGDQRRRSQADSIAQADQERLRGFSVQQLVALGPTANCPPTTATCRTVTLDGTDFTVTSTARFINTAGDASCSSSGSAAGAYFRIVSTVDWAANRRTQVVQESLITPPAGGSLITNVVDQSNQPLSDVTVTANGPQTVSALTSSEGCTIFAPLASGDYTVSVARDGYVDPDGNLSPSIPTRTATVSGSGTSFPSQNPFQLGDAGAINASFTTHNGALGSQQAPSLSVSHSGRANPLITIPTSPDPSKPTTFGPIATSGGTETLFPFTTGYTVWAGECPGQQPPAADRVTNAIVGAGTLNVTVKEPALNVRVYYPSYNSGSPTTNRVKPAHLKLYYTQTAGGTCSDSWYPPVHTNTGPAPPTNGWLRWPGQPYAGTTTVGSTTYNGNYAICAGYDTNGATTGGVRWGALLNQTNTDFTSNPPAARIVVIKSTDDFDASDNTYSGAGDCP